MSSWFAAIQTGNKTKLKNEHKYCLNNNHYPRHILKPKNIFKSKCDKQLKKKLKKYKLRKDGQEDEDVIDVSHTFLTVLKIKSPNSRALCVSSDDDIEFRPKNYLFNMAKRKHKVVNQVSETVVKESLETKGLHPASTLSQERRATNAFKLMMDSRNKSIGGNSPGKEKVSDAIDKQELIEKKEIKAKRSLVLQQLAESKGSLKNKANEEYEEQCIKMKMVKRADRLKNMIKNNGKPKKLKETKKINIGNNKRVKEPKQQFQLIDLFNDDSIVSCKDDDKCILTDVKLKQKSKEDEEFLKKLSPSIRKKENMLCYFNKIDKNVSADINDPQEICNENVIKVKVKSRNKTKNKSRKNLSLTKQSDDILKDHNENKSETKETETQIEEIVRQTKNSERRKRKRKENPEDVLCETMETNKILHNTDASEVNEVTEGGRRSKRSIKKPIKYIDDILLSSSDEELHIFTPKKLKPLEGKTKVHKKIQLLEIVHGLEEKKKNLVNDKEEKKVNKKPGKLAPIFNTKPQLTPEEMKAKQKFLYSGVPEQLKKITTQQTKNIPDFVNSYPVVVHIQQTKRSLVDRSEASLCDFQLDDNYDEDYTPNENVSFCKFLAFSKNQETFHILTGTNTGETTVLQNIKNSYPNFPVYRTYRLLKGKCKGDFRDASCPDLENSREDIKGLSDIVNENPDNLTWVDKYKALSTNQLIGNFEAVKELKKWLVTWTENEKQPRKSTLNDSDSSDFCYDSDMDSKDSMKTTDNLLVISGPVGCGKSSTVYAVATELAIKVIEVNASSKRTGKMMLQDLHEATQSHKVNRGTTNAETLQKSQEVVEKSLITYKNRGRPKKVYENRSKVALRMKKKKVSSPTHISHQTSVENTRTAMSLILIDDADIVFEQDDGFSSAIAQLVHNSKRPVILITSSLSCIHLQRFIQCGRVLNMHALLPRMLGTWLDILCLAERSMCWPGLGAKFLDHFKGDMRKTINSLQFYLSSVEKHNNVVSQTTEINMEDECSSLSWAEKEGVEESANKKIDSVLYHKTWKYFMGRQINSLANYHFSDLFSVWWSIPTLMHPIYRNNDVKGEEKHNTEVKSLEAIAKVQESLSVADYLSQITPDRQENICSQPWCEFETDSVSELEDMNMYFRSHHMNKEIINSLVTNSVLLAQKTLQVETKTEIEQPGMLIQRQRNKKISRHDSLTSFLNPSSILDRKALALDYWSTCRSICIIEKTKTDTVSKRNNRFCHYLKSMSAMCKTDSLDRLGDSLSSSNKLE